MSQVHGARSNLAPGKLLRRHGDEALARLSFVRRGRDLGFSLGEVRELLALASQDQRDCASVDAIASAHLAAVDRKIADLELGAVISSCQGGTIAQCRILEALAPQ